MTKGIIVGIISTLVIIGLIGGGFYLATRPKEEESVANSSDYSGDSIPLNVNGSNTSQSKPQQLAGTKLADFEPIRDVSELEIIDLEEGTGETVPEGATITAHYTGALAANGTIFQSSYDMGQPIQFGLDGVITGWSAGVPGMKVGGKRRLIIPAEMAYGANPPAGSGIPANAALVFDITLVSMP